MISSIYYQWVLLQIDTNGLQEISFNKLSKNKTWFLPFLPISSQEKETKWFLVIQGVYKCFPTQKSPHQRLSILKLSRLLIFQVSLSWNSLQNMKDEALYNAQNSRKPCHGFTLVHSTIQTLSTKSCHDFTSSCYKNCWDKLQILNQNCVPISLNCATISAEPSIINFETILNIYQSLHIMHPPTLSTLKIISLLLMGN